MAKTFCATSSDNHAQALAISGGDASHKRRNQCICPLPRLAFKTAKPRLAPNAWCHGPDTLAADHNHDALAMEVATCSYVCIYIRIHMYKGQILCICTLGKRYAFACWPSPGHLLALLRHLTRGQRSAPPPWSNFVIDTSSKALMPSASSVKVMIA